MKIAVVKEKFKIMINCIINQVQKGANYHLQFLTYVRKIFYKNYNIN
jgi:hypothetical protein